ncbi:hypothetical protein EJ07DRAFT_162076 [Lizonia empirigonia]|nr:hypothetical protein EJ07DRAFT_162076 [Lizonia empirigonia]
MAEVFGERAAELATLEAIYADSLIAHHENKYAGCIEVNVTLNKPLTLLCEDRLENHPDVHAISHLPLTGVFFELPEQYPTAAAPAVQLEADWIPGDVLSDLEIHVLAIWGEYSGSQVVYAYISYVQEAAESAFGLEKLEIASSLLPQLLKHDCDTKRQVFEKGTYECGVCLDPKQGVSCHSMSDCGHVFCIECLQSYFNNAILTGSIEDKAHLITSRELLQIPIECPMVQRFVNLKRKKKLETDRSTVWCPREWCQGAAKGNRYPKPSAALEEMGVVFEEDFVDVPTVQDEEDKADSVREQKFLAGRLQICEDCEYAYCKLCKHSWHGDFDRRARSDMPSERTQVEKDEEASLDFIRQNTTRCPKCETPVEKSEACNHMTRTWCSAHFCYLCSTYLNPKYPYGHFGQPGSFCYQRLWEGQNGEGVER